MFARRAVANDILNMRIDSLNLEIFGLFDPGDITRRNHIRALAHTHTFRNIPRTG